MKMVFWVMGRVDDVINVSGHRLGTMEVESALVSHLLLQAAVVSKQMNSKGKTLLLCDSRRLSTTKSGTELRIKAACGARNWCDRSSREIRFTDSLPKTRSVKSCGGCSGHWLLVRKFLATPPP